MIRKKLRKEIQFQGCGYISDAFDDVIKDFYNITDDEFDLLCEIMSNDELDIFLTAIEYDSTFGEKRNAFKIRNKYIKYYK